MRKSNPVADHSNGSSALGAWLKDTCKKEHLSFRKAANRAGVSHATISDIINGTRPSATTIVKLAEAFGNGDHQKAELKDRLLTLSGYRGDRNEVEANDSMSRVIDKIKQLNPAQLELIEQMAGFVTKVDKPGLKSLRSSTGVLVLPKLRLNFYLSFDEEESELNHFSSLPKDMQEEIVSLAERYEKEGGQAPDT